MIASGPSTQPALRALVASRNLFSNTEPLLIGDVNPWRQEYQFYGVNQQFRENALASKGIHTSVLSGPNDTGKTITCLSVLHEMALSNPGAELVMARKIKKSCYNTICRSFINKILPPNTDVVIFGGEQTPQQFIYPNGSRIYVEGMDSVATSEKTDNVNRLLSGEFDIIYVGQGEELSRNDIDKLRGRCSGRAGNLGPDYRAQLIMDVNPGSERHPIKQMEREGVLKMFNSRHRDNPDLYDQKTGELTEIGEIRIGVLRSFKGVHRARYYEGKWTGAGGLYFTAFEDYIHGLSHFELNPEWEIWASMDYGFVHPNAVFFHAKDSAGIMYTFHELIHQKMRPKHIAPIIHETLAVYGKSVDDLSTFLVGSDAFARNGRSDKTIVQQYAEHDIHLTAGYAGPGSRVVKAHRFLDLLGDPSNDERPEEPTWFYVRSTCPELEKCIPILTPDSKNGEAVAKIDANEDGEGGDDPWDGLALGFKDLAEISSISGPSEKLRKLRQLQEQQAQ